MAAPIAMRLAIRQWRARPLRPVLCSLAIAAAVALIVCVGTGFDSLHHSLRTAIGQMLGVADVHVRPIHKNSGNRLPRAMLEKVLARGDVELASGRMESHVAVTLGGETRWFDAVGIEPGLSQKLRPKVFVSGAAMTGAADEIVIDTNVAEVLKAEVGNVLSVSADGKKQRSLRVVGISKQPAVELLAKPTVLIPIKVLAEELRTEPAYNVIDVKLRESSTIEDFDKYAANMTQELGPTVQVTAGTNSRAKLNNETRSIQIILLLLATISAICAALIIGTTLSVGVQERVRQFGQLRCIGASRFQLVTFLLGDALVMMMLGEMLGIALGYALAWGLVWYFPQFFISFEVTFWSPTIAVLVGILATLLGASIPMWQVTRVTPMAAVGVVAKRVRSQAVWGAAAAGLACFVIQQLLWHGLPSRDARFFAYIFPGAPLIFLGFALLGPAAITLFEGVGAETIGRILRVRPTLLRSSWSSTPWRAGGMIAALMIGVTLFTTVGARVQSLRDSWVSPARLPDILLYSLIDAIPIVPNGLVQDIDVRAQELKAKHPEIADITAVTSFSIKIKTNFTRGGLIPGVDGPHFVAVDPQSFPRLVEMEYVQGSPEIALRQLAEGKHVFVSKEFYNLRGLGVGDKLTIMAANGKPVDFTIAAVVTSTGMELVKNYFDMRSVFQDHAVSSVLGTAADAKENFKARAGTLMLMNIKPGTSAGEVSELRHQLMQQGYPSVSSLELKSAIEKLIDRVGQALKIIAIGALIVASLGVANMVIASVHARRFEFGVLRAIGSGRGQLVRLVLAEVTLIALVAGFLGAAAGLYFAAMASLVDRLMIGFQTQFLAHDMIHRSWLIFGHLVWAVGLTTLLAWLASIGPAAKGAFSAQRTLLASGRG